MVITYSDDMYIYYPNPSTYRMITKKEADDIKRYIDATQPDTSRRPVSSGDTHFSISLSAHKMLKAYMDEFGEKHHIKRFTREKYLRLLLNQFAREQKAILHFMGANMQKYVTSTMGAMVIVKWLFKRYAYDKINTQSDAVVALLIYTTVRDYEVAHNMPVTDFLDRDYQAKIDDGEIRPFNITDPLSSVEDLFEEMPDPSPLPPIKQSPQNEYTKNQYSLRREK